MAIYGGSPWTRDAIHRLDADELADITATVPAGMYVSLGAAGRPGQWVVFLMQGEYGKATPVQRVDGVHHIPTGVRTAVNRWRAL